MTILLIIESFGNQLKKNFLYEFLTKNSLIDFFSFEQIYQDLVDTKQILNDKGYVSITENGIISLNFFLEKLPIDYQNTIVDLVKYEIVQSKKKLNIVYEKTVFKVFDNLTNKEIASFHYDDSRFISQKELEDNFKSFIDSIIKK